MSENFNSDNNLFDIDFQYFGIITFAMQQYGLKAVNSVVLTNKSGNLYKNLALEICSDVDVTPNFNQVLNEINDGESVEIKPNLEISAQFLLQLSEKIETNFILKISNNDKILLEKSFPLSVYPVGFWTGSVVLPELTAAYVTPNLPEISAITNRAARILYEWTQDGALDGYNSRNINRIRKIVASIYEAVKEQNLVYSLCPKSFEKFGQRVRFASEVLSQKTGNCMDTTLLFAACLENANLYPLIILGEGHAFVGVHLQPETFPNCVVDDVTEITKRIASGIGTICVFETTLVSNSPSDDFDTACHHAESTLQNPEFFNLMIDVERCRFSNINPLPIKLGNSGKFEIVPVENKFKDTHDKPQEISVYDIPTLNSENVQITKQNIWERKLLDLSLRNSLLNLKFTKKTLLLMSNNINKIEDILSDGKEFRILPRPQELKGSDDEFLNANITIASDSPLASFILHEIESKRLHSFLSEQANLSALKFIYRNSKTSIEENGANTLYLAVGLLRWFETDRSETPRYAPILLLPIEIIKRSATTGYIIRSRDEDVIANITLAEMLRQNYGLNLGLPDPLPLDESGVDVLKILAIVRHSIMSMPRWDVEEKVVIGNFSFNKFVMWNDIHNNHELIKENKIVASLITGKLQFLQDLQEVTANDLDQNVSPKQLILPVSADSSQLEAIKTAVDGNSFILFGPPGTGKSQTITNIIANALYNGQRVLFVAQKAAALSVVKERLDKLGLTPFCLDIFSNKTSKSYVLEQLKNAVEQTKYKQPEEFAIKADRLFELRTQLNAIVKSLHKKYPNNLSVYDAVSILLEIDKNVKDDVIFPAGLTTKISNAEAEKWFDIVTEASIICKSCGNPIDNKLNCLKINEYRQDLKLEIEQNIKQNLAIIPTLQLQTVEIAELLKIDNCNNFNNLENLKNLVEQIVNIKNMSQKVAAFVDENNYKEQYFNALTNGKHATYIYNSLRQKYSENVFNQDWQPELKKWKESEEKWFLSRFFAQRKIRKKLAEYSSNAQNVEPKQDILQILDYNKLKKKSLKFNELNEIFQQLPSETPENWDEKIEMLKNSYIINDQLKQFANNPQEFLKIKNAFADLFGSGFKSFKDFYSSKFENFLKLYNQNLQLSETLQTIAGLEVDAVKEDFSNNHFLEKRFALLQQIVDGIDGLKDWFMYLTIKKKAEENSMNFATTFFETTKINATEWNDVFKKSYYTSFVENAFAEDENLTLFKGEIFNDKILKYRELNSRYMQLAKAELVALLSSRLPDFNIEAAQNSETGILLRNIRNNGRGTTIRNIFDQIPNLLFRLCPCMLMSPMSVSQYLNLEKQEKFDITIFDEASQMPTSDAVGAIARSKNVIITGDPKQMPPTSFFASNQVDEDNIEIEDLESILDDALALSIKSKHLLWHYRSKHESLIAFSNSEYYENKLLTFPSPDNRISKVSFVKVDGFYDKGKSRRNPAEARAVVDEIRRRLSDKNLQNKSIGVVTFSIVQQQLIDDMLTDLFASYPELEKIATSGNEPIFIKNLENVQGDERDVILFSVGYGPDKTGKVSMNFGPLNQNGGERRLNVAVSRARYEMKIFSTLTSDMIDLNRTSSKGVEGLKKFLNFAQRGVNAIKVESINNVSKNIVAEQVAQKLREHGYTADTAVGCSGFRIDVAVCNPEKPQQYMLAIVCDADDPAKNKTARDREIIQPDILKALGWKILKIWTLDWYNDSNKVLENILQTIKNIEQNSDSEQNVANNQQTEIVLETLQTSNSENIYKQVDYQVATLPKMPEYVSFVNGRDSAAVAQQLSTLIETEAPILEEYAIKRIAEIWNSRVTQTFYENISNIIKKYNFKSTTFNGKTTLWNNTLTEENYTAFRQQSGRETFQIPCYEIANAIKYLIINQIAVPTDELKRQTSKIMGFSRMTSNVETIVTEAINYLKSKNQIIENDGKLMMAK